MAFKPLVSLLFVLFYFSSSLFSQIITTETANTAAFSFIKEMNENVKSASGIQHLYTANTSTSDPAWYVFSTGEKGFIIIAADLLAYPVLGYSYNTSFFPDPQFFPPSFRGWMDARTSEIEEVRQMQYPADSETIQLWNELLTGTFSGSALKSRSVDPLLVSQWNQDCFYNELCPAASTGPCGRVYAGCVATAMAQIMYYWRFPQTGNGTNSYSSPYGTQYANFGTTTYKWDEMKGSVNSSHPELAKLLYHAAISVNMNFSPNGSGANSEDVSAALRNKFRYHSATYRNRYFYSTVNWTSLIKTSIDNKHPVYYSGSGASGGHAFITDGYQGTEHFHFDWGWSGAFNGYYYLNNLNPGSNTFTNSQKAVIDIYPPSTSYPQYCSGQKTLTAVSGSFSDGSGPISNYQANSNCSWLIKPSVPVDFIRLTFVKFDTENGQDFVTVYDGETTSAPVLGTFSGANLPSMIQTNGQAMLVTFTSNGSVQNSGFLAEYFSVPSKFCSGTVIITDPSGTFDDGSGPEYQYTNSSNCRWVIEPPGATFIHIYFTEFDTEPVNDKVRILNLDNSSVVAEFSGSQLPPPIEINATKVMIHFTSNATVQGNGWAIAYSTVTDISKLNDPVFSVFPNPSSGKVFVRFQNQSIWATISLFDLSGRLVLTEEVLPNSETAELDISHLSPGLYIVQSVSDGKQFRTKLSIF